MNDTGPVTILNITSDINFITHRDHRIKKLVGCKVTDFAR